MRVAGIPYVQGRNSYGDGDGRKYGIAIHNTANDASAEGEASYATRRTDGVSAHFYADHDSVVQSLDTAARAGHAGSRTGNEHAIAVEITGVNGWSRQQWLDRVAWDKLGRVLAAVCKQYGIAARRAGVAEMRANPKVKAFYGHDDMRRAWGGTTHTDPGPNFPWDRLFQAVTAALTDSKENTMTTVDLTQAAIDAVAVKTWKVTYGNETPESRLIQARDAAINSDRQSMFALAGTNRLETAVARIEATLADILGRDWVNEQEIVSGVLAGLGAQPAEQVASALVAAGHDPAALRDALSAHIGTSAR